VKEAELTAARMDFLIYSRNLQPAASRRLPLPPGLAIDWREGSAVDLPFKDGAFDVVLCQQAIGHHWQQSQVPRRPGRAL
jgi:2-polyprenyl-3-methyl-5-hydroxy-6-metoxy-1,4-benzoquinol methylase